MRTSSQYSEILEQQVQVQPGVVAALLEGGGYHLHRRMGVAEGQRRVGGIGNGSARLGRLDDVGRRHAAHVVAMDVHRQADFGVEGLHHALGTVRGEHARHVLDGNRVSTQVLQLLAVVQKAVQGMHRRNGVGDGPLEMGAALFDGLGVVYHIADVVEGVEHAKHLDAVAMGGRDEVVHDVFGIVLVAHQVLTTGEHGQRGVGSVGLDGAQPFPRVLIQKAQAGIECGTAPSLDGPVPHAVHLGQDGQHLAYLHARGPKALLAVADGGVHYLKPRHGRAHLLFSVSQRSSTQL